MSDIYFDNGNENKNNGRNYSETSYAPQKNMNTVEFFAKQKIFSIGEKFEIFDTNGNIAYLGKGKIFKVPKTFLLYDNNNKVCLTIKRKFFSFLPKYYIYEGKSNKQLAFVSAKFRLFRSKVIIRVQDEDYVLNGDVFSWNFTIDRGGFPVMTVSKKIIAIKDKYSIKILENENIPLLLSIVMIFDHINHNGKNGGR